MEAGGKVVLEETDAVTTVLVASVKFLGRQRDLARRFVAAHQELSEWIRGHPDEAQAVIRDELAAETHTEVKPALVARAWPRIVVTGQVADEALQRFVAKAKAAGFLRTAPDLSRLVEKP
jgi:NitT/TauT family transport system substrate-binding protein